MPTIDDFDELSLAGIEIGALTLNVERLTASFGQGYGASASVGAGSGLWGWELGSDLMPDAASYGSEIDGLPRFEYYTRFYLDHTEGDAGELFVIDFRGRKYLASFDTESISGEMLTYDLFSLDGVKLKMRRVKGLGFNADGSIDITPPTVPTGLAGVATGPTSIHWSWDASTDPDGGGDMDIIEDGGFLG